MLDTDNSENQKFDFDLFRSLYEAIAGEFGEVFIERLVRALNDTLDAEFVAVTRGEGDPINRVRTIFAWDNGGFRSDVSYKLEHTPCAAVFQGREVVIPCDLAALFPGEDGLESYVGVPLRSSAGHVSGHLMVVSATKLGNSEAAASILRVFAKRAEVELQRIDYEDERQRMIGDLQFQTDRLQTLYRAAHDANLFKTRLVGLIAHDLRGPLSTISAQAELAQAFMLRDTPDSTAKTIRACEKINRNVERMSEQIDATLDRVRSECRMMKPKIKSGDIVEIARSVLEANKCDAKKKSISLLFRAPQSLRAAFDEALLFSAIDNLVTNAIKYTHPGGSATLEVRVDQRGETILEVADTGQGLSREDCARAFQDFQTLSAKPTGSESSTGMGLASVKAIAEAHDGRVAVTSEGIGCGASFSIVIPDRFHSLT
ncbi:HAMP domain-containing sensor histidine kinase [uncultured Roseobacter sp.]|uniref:GAF domain-containing sensor histidine kinase n=1 Tax=uncultured Roseobacter sp. TaxID=114847 RepID=UPI00260FBAC5|nr:HAMP domain-containing sensor histidine kinase [uncultured Roseobacter sp.]